MTVILRTSLCDPGYPGIPPGADRPQAAVKGVRIPHPFHPPALIYARPGRRGARWPSGHQSKMGPCRTQEDRNPPWRWTGQLILRPYRLESNRALAVQRGVQYAPVCKYSSEFSTLPWLSWLPAVAPLHTSRNCCASDATMSNLVSSVLLPWRVANMLFFSR